MVEVTAATALARAADPQSDAEAFAVLCAMARSKAGAIPADLLARHVLRVTPDADFTVRHDAMEALLRRVALAEKDGLRIVSRPKGRAVYGDYRTASEHGARPWTSLLRSIDPIELSCDCPDYLRSALGLCKHGVIVLGQALTRAGTSGRVPPVSEGPALQWDPVRPLLGPGDWLDRLRFVEGPPRRGARSLAEAAVRRWFTDEGALRESAHGLAAQARHSLVRDLRQGLQQKRVAADPAVVPLLAREEKLLALCAPSSSEAAKRYGAALSELKHPLYPYQRESVLRFLERGRLLLADDMGLGKTAQAIAACHALFREGEVDRGLILVPAALKPQWEREWRDFTSAPLTVVDGGADERERLYVRARRQRGFLLGNYEQVLRDLPHLQRLDPQLVVLDEAQRIKNWATRTSAAVKALQPARRLVLTGTPMENRLDELASLIDWVDDLALEPKWRLSSVHAARADGSREVVGARNLETLRTRLSGCMLRRRRDEVLGQLPSRTDTRLLVALTPEQQTRHDELNEPIARLLASAHRRPLTQAEFLRLMSLMTTQRVICNGLGQLEFEQVWPELSRAARPNEAQLRSLCAPKLLELRELVAQIAVGQGRKVVVFSQWRRMLKLAAWAVGDLLGDAGLRGAFFTGEESQKRRTQNLVDFHDDPSTRVLFCSDAGGVGLNLQKAASCLINLELPWNPAVLEQRIGRVHRNGQKRPVEVYHLVSATGIEARIASLVGDKRALFTGLFDGTSDAVVFERSGSFLSKMEKVLAPVAAVPGSGGEAARAELSSDAEGIDDAQQEVEAAGDDVALAADSVPPGEAVKGSETGAAAEVRAGDGAGPAAGPMPSAVGAPVAIGDLRALFSSVQVRPGKEGRVTFEAPAEAAAAIAAVFEGMARLFGSSGVG